MSLTEILGFVTGVVNVWLLARQNIWNWPVGLANNALYLAIFLSSGLYGDAGLQAVFILLAIYGWWTWLRARSSNLQATGAGLVVQNMSRTTWSWLIPVTLLSAAALRWFLMRFTDSTVPGWDGLATALSLAAIYGQCKKLLECWWIWITVDVIYIPLYIYKGLRLTAALYLVFMILCVMGLREWKKALAGREIEETV